MSAISFLDPDNQIRNMEKRRKSSKIAEANKRKFRAYKKQLMTPMDTSYKPPMKPLILR